MGHGTSFAMDSLAFTPDVYDVLNQRSTTVFDAVGQGTAQIDVPDHSSTFSYDLATRRKGALCNRSTAVSDAANNVTAQVDELNRCTTFAYDVLNRQVGVQDALGFRSTTVYDVVGNVSATINENNRRTTMVYDEVYQVIARVDALGNRATSVFDAAGNVTRLIDEMGKTTTLSYDVLNRFISAQKPTGGIETTVYDAVGNTVASVDALNKRSTMVYDELNRVVNQVDALNGTTTLVYDAVGNRTVVIDSVGNRTTSAYDVLNREVSRTDPRNQTGTFAYDAISRMTSSTDRLDRRRDFAFDAVGRNTTEKWYSSVGALEQTHTFTYDVVGNQLTAQDPDGVYTMTFDAANQTKTVAEPFGVSLTFTYDGVSNRREFIDSLGGVTTTSYSALNQMTVRYVDGSTVTGLRFDRTYNARGEVRYMARYADIAAATRIGSTTTEIDDGGRAKEIIHRNGAGTNLRHTTYAYDAADRLTGEKIIGSSPVSYTYDVTDQLKNDGVSSYSYDANGNRTNSGYTTGAGNQLTNDGTWAYSYDDEGNLTKKSKGASLETWTYGYDHRNQMTWAEKRATDGGTLQARVEYAYDAWGNRISRKVLDGSLSVVEEQRFAYDGWKTRGGERATGVGLENWDVWADLDGSNALVMRRVFTDQVDQVIARETAAGVVSWYVANRQGSVELITDAAGAVIDALTYDGFGNVLTESSPSNGDRYGYTGREYDDVLSLQYNHERFLNLTILQFTSEDPIGFAGGEWSLYRYVGNSPTNGSDPSGLQSPSGFGFPGSVRPSGGNGASGGSGGSSNPFSPPPAWNMAGNGLPRPGLATGGQGQSGGIPGRPQFPGYYNPKYESKLDLNDLESVFYLDENGKETYVGMLTRAKAKELRDYLARRGTTPSWDSWEAIRNRLFAVLGVAGDVGTGLIAAGLSELPGGQILGYPLAGYTVDSFGTHCRTLYDGQHHDSLFIQSIATSVGWLTGDDKLGQDIAIGADVTVSLAALVYSFKFLIPGKGGNLIRIVDVQIDGGPGVAAAMSIRWTTAYELVIDIEQAQAIINAFGKTGSIILSQKGTLIFRTANPGSGGSSAPLTGSGGIRRFPEWKVGDQITKITPEGNYPSWSTIRGRYWENRVAAARTGEFGPSNTAIMQQGFAPKARVIVRNRNTGQTEERLVEKELHHAQGGRGTPGMDEPIHLREVWPWEHEKIDPSRHLDYDFLGFK